MADGNAPPALPQSRKRKRRRGGRRLYAALDLGTNNCRLLVAAPARNGFRVVDGYSRIVRLGEGLEHTNNLSEQAQERALQALKSCAYKLGKADVKRTWAVATQACRRAENGDAFIQRVKDETGLQLDVISSEQEAKLALRGCGDLLDHSCEAAMVVDIGGGSTEITWVWLDGKGAKGNGQSHSTGRLGAWTSLDMGVVTLSDRFPEHEERESWFAEMRAHARGLVAGFTKAQKFREAFERGNVHVVGTSGAVTSLGGLHLDLDRYRRDRVDGLWMSHVDTWSATERLLSKDIKQRAQEPCIGPERADLVLAGCAILQAVLDEWPSERIRVADRGLREGLLLSMMRADRRGRRGGRKRRSRKRKPAND